MAIIAGAIASLLAGVVSAYSAYQQGEAASAAARYNARVAEQQATAAQQAAGSEAESRRRRLEQVLGTQRAQYGASGIAGSEGSPLLVMMQSEEQAALEVARVRHGGAVAAYGFGIEAQQQRRAGAQARRQARLAAAGALLQGVSGAARVGATSQSPSATPPRSVPRDVGGYGTP